MSEILTQVNVDSEDADLVRNIHCLDKASDHRAVGEFVQFLSHKQNGRNMIRQSVSPFTEADLGWDKDEDDGLPEWPLWWQTSFGYTVFSNLVIEYLRSVQHMKISKVLTWERAVVLE